MNTAITVAGQWIMQNSDGLKVELSKVAKALIEDRCTTCLDAARDLLCGRLHYVLASDLGLSADAPDGSLAPKAEPFA